MITPAYAPTATERVLPRLALDFTTGVLDSRVTVTRSLNTATRVNSSGLIELVNANLPRFDYDPVTLSPKGLLIEETKANLLLYSEQINDATWAKTGATVTANAVTSPDGTANADKLVEDTANSTHSFSQTATGAATTTYTYSIYAKAAERTKLAVWLRGASSGNRYEVGFDLSNGTTFSGGVVGNFTNGSATITAAGGGWYRCVVTATTGAGETSIRTPTFMLAGSAVPSNAVYTGDGSSGMFFYGAQLETGAFATSYIPTTTTSLTRNADVVTMTGTNFSSWYNASEGTFVAHAAIPSAGGTTRRILSINDTTTNESIQLAILGASNGGYFEMRDGGAIQVSTTNGSFTAGALVGYAFAYKLNDCAVSSNATTATTDTSATLPTVSQMNIGSHAGTYMSGTVSRIEYYPQRVINAQTQALSK